MANLVYRLFASLRIAIIIIIIIAVVSVLGTIIPQNRDPIFYKTNFPNSWYYILLLDFDDLFRSNIYLGLLLLLAFSTIVCTYTRTKITFKKFYKRLKSVSIPEIASYRISTRIESTKLGNFYQLEKFEKLETDNGTIYLRTTGKLSLLGSPLIHIGLLFILLGAIISHYTGVEMAITGVEGDKVAIPSIEAIKSAHRADKLRKKVLKLNLLYPNLQPVFIENLKKQIQSLEEEYNHSQNNPKYWLIIKKLWIEYYDNGNDKKSISNISTSSHQIGVNPYSDNVNQSFINTNNSVNNSQNFNNGLHDTESLIANNQSYNDNNHNDNSKFVKNWNTLIEILNSNNEIIASGIIKVNQPFSFDNITFYQANWQKVYHTINLIVTSNPISTEPSKLVSEPKFLTLCLGEEVKPEWSSLTFTLFDFMPDFRIVDNNFVSISDEIRNPAARIVAYNQDGSIAGRAWAFSAKQSNAGHIFSNLPYNFTFHSAQPKFQTGLQLSYDPYVWIVWLGCLFMICGLWLTFFIAYYEEWIVIRNNNLSIIAVNGNRPEANLKSKFIALTQELNITI